MDDKEQNMNSLQALKVGEPALLSNGPDYTRAVFLGLLLLLLPLVSIFSKRLLVVGSVISAT